MAKCSGITRAGTACKGIPIDGSQWCYVHHPGHVEERKRHGKRGGRRGGRGRLMAELSGLKAQLADLYTSVLTDMIEPKVGAVLSQITNAQIRATEVELRVREQLEILERVEELERLLAVRNEEGGRWGA